MAGTSLMQRALENYVALAVDVIKIKLIKSESDIDREDISFSPEFTHQIFGEGENIYGYLGLKVDIFYTASRLLPLIQIKYDSIVPSKELEPDNIERILAEKLEIKFESNVDQFIKLLKKETGFKPFGTQAHCFTITDNDGNHDTYEVYHTSMEVPGFRDYYERMQSFILWFIESASFIDIDDSRWEYFVLYQRVVLNGSAQYFFAGYTTVYCYYGYPSNTRPRISQMLVLPPYQKQGLGAELLQSIYKWYIQKSEVLDITVEEPSDNFIRLRDYVDCINCMKLMSFHRNNLKKGFDEKMANEAREKYKICKKQARRVYEILRLKSLNKNDSSQYRAYRLDVKKRLNAPYQRQKLDLQKLQQALNPKDAAALYSSLSTETRIEQLDTLYKDLESEYERVLKRISEHST